MIYTFNKGGGVTAFTVTFMNGLEVWETVRVKQSETAVCTKGDPEKPEDESYTYSFVGWASSDSQEAGEEGILDNIQESKVVYAAFKATAKKLYAFPDTISKSWDEIIADANAGRTSEYSLGDIKNLDLLDGEYYLSFELCGINTDSNIQGEKLPFTFISKTVIPSSKYYNLSSYAGPDFTKLEAQIPENLKAAIKFPGTEIKLWCPSKNDMESYYSWYQLPEHRIRYEVDKKSTDKWKTRATLNGWDYYDGSMSRDYIDEDGSISQTYDDFGTPIVGFCL